LFDYSGFQHILTIWVIWRVSYKRQDLLALCGCLSSLPGFGGVSVAHRCSYLCCGFFCLRPVSCVANNVASFTALPQFTRFCCLWSQKRYYKYEHYEPTEKCKGHIMGTKELYHRKRKLTIRTTIASVLNARVKFTWKIRKPRRIIRDSRFEMRDSIYELRNSRFNIWNSKFEIQYPN
jgi:hypothetical protein